MVRLVFLAILVLTISGHLFSQSAQNRVMRSDTARIVVNGKEKTFRYNKKLESIRHETARDTVTFIYRIQKGDTITRTKNPNRPQENIENPLMRVKIKEED